MTGRIPKLKCIMCNTRKKKQGSLFCEICGRADIFVKLISFKKSEDYKKGYLTYGKQNYGRLPTREEREIEKYAGAKIFEET